MIDEGHPGAYIYDTSYTGTAGSSVISFTGLSIALTSSHVYELIAIPSSSNKYSDEVVVPVYPSPLYPIANADLSVTSGVFSGATGSGYPTAFEWASSQTSGRPMSPRPPSRRPLSRV